MSSSSVVETAEELRGSTTDESEEDRLDRTFSLLGNRRRRLVLSYLREHESTTQSDLAKHVAALENDVPESAVTSAQRKRVYVALYQSHLPKLDDFDAVSFDPDRGTVERAPRTEELLRYLDRFEASSTSPSSWDDIRYPAGTLLLAAALVTVFLGRLDALPVDFLLGLAVLLSVVGMIVVAVGVRR